MNQPLLTVSGISKRFGGITALDDLSFTVHRGEILGIVGPNGAGKSAMINVVSGIYPSDAGTITLAGRDLTRLPAHERSRAGIARTFQNIRLFGRMSVMENVLLARKEHVRAPLRSIFAGRRRELAADAMQQLEAMRLAAKADWPASSLAYGEARRLEIARALATRPALLFLDEPAAGMNDQETALLIEDIRTARAGVDSIVIVEHDVALLRKLSDRMVALNFGSKIAEGSPNEVLSHPEVTRAYLGTAHDAD
jgi:branched-chain amino acid transport system ATP-binding protein